MSKVKFNANGEWAYVQNFKVLQSMNAIQVPPRRNSARETSVLRLHVLTNWIRFICQAPNRQADPRRGTHQVQDAG